MNRNLLTAALIFGLVLTLIGFFLIFKVYQTGNYFVDNNRHENSNLNAEPDVNNNSTRMRDKKSTSFFYPNNRKENHHRDAHNHRRDDRHHDNPHHDRRDDRHHDNPHHDRRDDDRHHDNPHHDRRDDDRHHDNPHHDRRDDRHHDNPHHDRRDDRHHDNPHHDRRDDRHHDNPPHDRSSYNNKAHNGTNLVPLDGFSKKSSSEKNKKTQNKEEILKRGKRVFQQNCFSCHSTLKKADRIFYPSLEEMKSHKLERFKEIVQKGIPGTAMIPRAIPEKDIEAIYLWLNQLDYNKK